MYLNVCTGNNRLAAVTANVEQDELRVVKLREPLPVPVPLTDLRVAVSAQMRMQVAQLAVRVRATAEQFGSGADADAWDHVDAVLDCVQRLLNRFEGANLVEDHVEELDLPDGSRQSVRSDAGDPLMAGSGRG